ncbi:MAG: hypothetical protein AAF551_06445 [Bacteroidota bacterium]
MKTLSYSIGLYALLAIGFSGCQQDLFEDRKTIRHRVIGFEAGSIEYSTFEDQGEVVATLHFSQGSLKDDETIIPNIYHFSDDVLLNDLPNIDLIDNFDIVEDFDDIDSLDVLDSLTSILHPNGEPELIEDLIKGKDEMRTQTQWNTGRDIAFVYFIPVDFRTGYSSENVRDLSLTYFVDFNVPVTMELTFWLDNRRLDRTDYQPYRIEMPRRCNETDSCTWIEDRLDLNWSEEGYIAGYSDIDLTYLINGRWRKETEYGLGEMTVDHWEAISDFEVMEATDSVRTSRFRERTLQEVLDQIASGEITLEELTEEDAEIQAVDDLASIEDVPAAFRYVASDRYYFKHTFVVEINNFDYIYCIGRNFN